jgi:hypothetical protein
MIVQWYFIFPKDFVMPYYVYKVTTFPIKLLELVQTFDKFKEASAFAKIRRTELAEDDKSTVKVIFGENQLQAEDTLNEYREPQPVIGDDY